MQQKLENVRGHFDEEMNDIVKYANDAAFVEKKLIQYGADKCNLFRFIFILITSCYPLHQLLSLPS